MGPGEKVFDGVLFAFDDHLDGAVATVLYPTGEAGLARFALGGGAVVDALHPSADDQLDSLLAHETSLLVAERGAGTQNTDERRIAGHTAGGSDGLENRPFAWNRLPNCYAPRLMAEQKPYIGGQAVIEGVMMKAPGGISIAVRRPDNSLVVHEEAFASKFKKGLWKLPGLRGVATLVESLSLGWRCLKFSADQQMTEEEREEEGEGKMTMVISTVFALALFIALPQLLAAGSGKLFGIEFGLSDASYQAVIGGFKLLIFFGYMVAISQVEEIRRTFQYHGAEHKTIHAWEAELPLTVENVRKQTTLHPRCGTTFLVLVIMISIVLGSLTAPVVIPEGLDGWQGQLALLALRIGLLPVIAGVSFEFQRFTARYATKGPLQVLLLPGFLFQKISTREPDDSQIEVAITAMQAAAWREKVGDTAETGEDLVFESFSGFQEALPKLRPMRAGA